MAYEPKTWTCGETITADELNRMEQGIAQSGGGGYFVVNFLQSFDTSTMETVYTSDKTNEQIYEAFNNGQIVICKDGEHVGHLIYLNEYSARFRLGEFDRMYDIMFSKEGGIIKQEYVVTEQ